MAGPTLLDRYRSLTPKSAALAERAVASMPSGVTHDSWYPATLSAVRRIRGLGSRKWDVDGREYVDYAGGHGAPSLGHSHPAIVEAVERQVRLGPLRHRTNCKCVGPSWYASWCEWRGTSSLHGFRYGSDLAGRATCPGRNRSAQARAVPRLFSRLERPHGVRRSLELRRLADARRTRRTDRTGRALRRRRRCRSSRSAESARCRCGDYRTDRRVGDKCRSPRSFSPALGELTSATGTVLIFDEVISGFRCSPGGAQSAYGITPDMTTLAKILAGGLPGGAVVGRRDLLESVQLLQQRRAEKFRTKAPSTPTRCRRRPASQH